MNGALTLGAALLLGFAASGHCLVMCGGISAALGMAAAKDSQGRTRPAIILAYQLGRIFSYALAGLLLAGILGGLVSLLDIESVRRTLRAIVGAGVAARRAGRVRQRARSGRGYRTQALAAARAARPAPAAGQHAAARFRVRHGVGLDALRLRVFRAADRHAAARCREWRAHHGWRSASAPRRRCSSRPSARNGSSVSRRGRRPGMLPDQCCCSARC